MYHLVNDASLRFIIVSINSLWIFFCIIGLIRTSAKEFISIRATTHAISIEWRNGNSKIFTHILKKVSFDVILPERFFWFPRGVRRVWRNLRLKKIYKSHADKNSNATSNYIMYNLPIKSIYTRFFYCFYQFIMYILLHFPY